MAVNLVFAGAAPDIGAHESPFSDTALPIMTAFSIPVLSNSLTVPIQRFTALDNVRVNGYLVTDTAAEPSATTSEWQAAPPATFKAASQGKTTLYAWAKDLAGNVSIPVSAVVTIDTEAPTTTASPAGGEYRESQQVALTCHDGTGSGCDRIYYSLDGSTPTTESTVYAAAIPVAAAITLRFFATDLAGNSEPVKTQTYSFDTTAPAGSLTINSGSAYTRSTSAVLTVSCTDVSGSCSQMQFSNDNVDWSLPEPYATAKAWTLSAADGIK